MGNEKNFIDFILDAQKNEDLVQGFFDCEDVEQLKAFFGDEYKVESKDCEKLINAKKDLGLEWPLPPSY